jgi:uncharacterized protein YacL
MNSQLFLSLYPLVITNAIKTILMIIGVFVVLRFFGQLMIAKRNSEEHKQYLKKKKEFDAEKKYKTKNLGRTKLMKNSDIQDVDFQDLSDE